MKKKILLLSIIIFPSLLYFMFELTQANFKKMPYFGPKTVNEKGDTVYWTVPAFGQEPDSFEVRDINASTGAETISKTVTADQILRDTTNYPVYLILFLNEKIKREGYKLEGIYDYIKYKPQQIAEAPFVICSDTRAFTGNMQDSLKLPSNFSIVVANISDREKALSNTYFKNKPVHIFDYFAVLIDKKRHIRGYYDPSFNAEVKRMIDEYKHLKIRDEYAETLKQNDIKQNESK